MKFAIAGAVGTALLAGTAFAAQVLVPMKDPAAAKACAPKDIVAAVACLEQHLTADVKDQILKAKNVDELIAPQLAVATWVRDNWGLWTGSPLAQYLVSKKVQVVPQMSDRLVQAMWLKNKGCTFDINEPGYLTAAVAKSATGQDPCAVTVAEARQAGAVAAPYGRGETRPQPPAAARRGRAAPAAAAAGRAAAQAATPAPDDAEDEEN
jgi:hypothetical protein